MELKVGFKRWLLMFICSVLGVALMMDILIDHSSREVDSTLFFSIVFLAAAVITGAVMGGILFFQRKVILGNEHLKIIGYFSKTIPYEKIEMIQIGSGGLTIYGNGTKANITTLYKDFPEAVAFLRSKIDFNQIPIKIAGKDIPAAM